MIADDRDLWPHTGAVFCGGHSERMGRPKAGIVLPDGRTMLDHVVAAVSAVCRHVVLVGADCGLPRSVGRLRRIEDRVRGIGPLGGLEALLAGKADSEYLIVPCDVYRLTPRVLRLLVEPDVEPPAVLARSSNGKLEPLFGRYGFGAYAFVQTMIEQGHLSLRELAQRCNALVVRVPIDLESTLHNANTPEDFGNDLDDQNRPNLPTGSVAKDGCRSDCGPPRRGAGSF